MTPLKITHELRNLRGALRAVESIINPQTHEDAHFIVADVSRRLGLVIEQIAKSYPPPVEVEVEPCPNSPR